MSVLVKSAGGGHSTLTRLDSQTPTEGNYSYSYPVTKAGLYVLIVAGSGSNTNTINTATCSDGTVVEFTVVSNTASQAKSLTKTFIINANSGATIAVSGKFQGYSKTGILLLGQE